jgi:hypothetical protein
MFETIEKEGGSRGPEWLSSHPNPGNREERIAQEAKLLGVSSARRNQSAEFSQVQASLQRMPPAQTMAEIASTNNTKPNSSSGSRYPDNARVGGVVEPPSSRYRTFQSGPFQMSVPDNWKEFGDNASVTFAPAGAFGNQEGQSVFTHGAIVGIVEVSASDLQTASDQYISGILQGNNYLASEGRYQQTRLGGRNALTRRLSGTSRVTNQSEIVDVYTTLLNNRQLFYVVQVAPAKERRQYTKAFSDMLQSLRFLN